MSYTVYISFCAELELLVTLTDEISNDTSLIISEQSNIQACSAMKQFLGSLYRRASPIPLKENTGNSITQVTDLVRILHSCILLGNYAKRRFDSEDPGLDEMLTRVRRINMLLKRIIYTKTL